MTAARSPWGPEWADVAACLERHGWSEAVPVREQREGGYSAASRWIVERPDGARAFIKATSPPAPAGLSGAEKESIVGHADLGDVVPALLGAVFGGDDSPTVLVLEDLSDARWGTPVTPADARSLRDALETLASRPAPWGLDPLAPHATHDRGWRHVDPEAAERVGIAPAAWIERHRDVLVAASDTVDVSGDSLVHDDLWLQNWCRAERGAVLVDWAGAALGNARLNHAWGEAGIRASGGPAGIVLGAGEGDHDGWAAYMAGLATSFLVGDEQHAEAMPRLHATQAREAIACITWACDALEIERPPIAPVFASLGPWEP